MPVPKARKNTKYKKVANVERITKQKLNRWLNAIIVAKLCARTMHVLTADFTEARKL